jgi:hypothetical protein
LKTIDRMEVKLIKKIDKMKSLNTPSNNKSVSTLF